MLLADLPGFKNPLIFAEKPVAALPYNHQLHSCIKFMQLRSCWLYGHKTEVEENANHKF